jgi:hypothetical protein
MTADHAAVDRAGKPFDGPIAPALFASIDYSMRCRPHPASDEHRHFVSERRLHIEEGPARSRPMSQVVEIKPH